MAYHAKGKAIQEYLDARGPKKKRKKEAPSYKQVRSEWQRLANFARTAR
jgi:hypothetical protein